MQLVSFNEVNGFAPLNETLVQGRDTGLYGTTDEGGSTFKGTAFRITPQGLLSVYTFDGTSGTGPCAGFLLGLDGLLRGVTQFGGASNDGIVYSISPHASVAVIASFDGANGSTPQAPLVQGIDGYYYGTTVFGGAHNFGTVFRLAPTGIVTTLHSFDASVGPQAGALSLVYGPDNTFYGMTNGGGAANLGTIFKITPSGKFSTLYSFSGGANGANPLGNLLLASDGNFYGTTQAGGVFNMGTVFRLDTTGVTVLRSFSGDDGADPASGVIQATDGNLYGTTAGGGETGCGTIFSMALDGTNFSLLHSFNFENGCSPWALMQHTDGMFFGTTYSGGASNACGFAGCGTVFSQDVGLPPFVTFVRTAGKVGQTGGILGQGFTGTTSVELNGVPANFTVVSDTYLTATVPSGATTGYVTVTTPTGVLTSNVPFHVIQ